MTRRFVSIWFPRLATDYIELQQPQLKDIPFVLTAQAHNRIVITAANIAAQAKGIYYGMVLADARAMYPALRAFEDKLTVIQRLLNRIAQWCIRFTPIAAVDGTDGILLDATGCSHLWGGEELYLQTMLDKIHQKGFAAKACMAPTIGTAWAVARYGKQLLVEQQQNTDALLQLPVSALRLEAETVERLTKLGLRQIHNVVSIPSSALRRRFGRLIVQRLQQALGKEEELLTPVHIPEPYHERLPCMEPIVSLPGIEIALQQLLATLCSRLVKDGKGLRTAVLQCYRVDNNIVQAEISTSAPSNSAKHLFHLFQLKLSSIEPALGIELFILEALDVQNHSPIQEEIWKQHGRIKDNRLSELIDRISAKVGVNAINRYLPDEHHIPERSFKKALLFHEQPATVWKLDRPRPICLLSPPEYIEVTAPVPDYPPMMFRYKGKLHKIMKADGPERIEQEWWLQDGQHRDYYTVEDEEGCRYWLFRSGHYDTAKTYQWFIHGFFA